MEKICKNCEYWEESAWQRGKCLNTKKLVSADKTNEAPLDGLLYGDGADEQRAFLCMGALFGCVHCKRKKKGS